jgi:hypothetical protein
LIEETASADFPVKEKSPEFITTLNSVFCANVIVQTKTVINVKNTFFMIAFQFANNTNYTGEYSIVVAR